MADLQRRSFMRLGLAAVCAPAVIRVAQLMPIKALPPAFLSSDQYAAVMFMLAQQQLRLLGFVDDGRAALVEPMPLRIKRPVIFQVNHG